MASIPEIHEEIGDVGRLRVLEQTLDSPMEEEAWRLRNLNREEDRCKNTSLCLGVVYGDLGTSPLYVFYNTFPMGIDDPEDVIGALSMIIYSLILIPLLKYVVLVLRANDNGQGGTSALYSLLCRHAKIKTIPNQHRTDEELTNYSRHTFHEKSFAAKTKKWLEAHDYRKTALLIPVLVGTCMMIGDGILTPAMSDTEMKTLMAVLSASGGIQVAHPKMSDDVVVVVAVVILVGLFRDIGAFNIWKHGHTVLKAFSPVYVYRFFTKGSWSCLGGIMLSITGTEALFADLGLIPALVVRIAFTLVVFPSLQLVYIGQAAYLMKNPGHVSHAFYHSIPSTAVVIGMLVTTFLMILVMLLVWGCHWSLVAILAGFFLLIECTYFSNVIFKIDQGGWVPLVISAIFLIAMYVWQYGTMKRYAFEMSSVVPTSWILGLGPSLGLVRVQGIGLVYTELASGVPRIFSHMITNLPVIHTVVVFVCVKYLPVCTEPQDERFLVKQIGPKDFHMFRYLDEDSTQQSGEQLGGSQTGMDELDFLRYCKDAWGCAYIWAHNWTAV
ncbi:hypothetical protein IFM89_035726 [Coptis chinensis]|uniref:Potassium transporter n=1 Tax=Coptis chinensis TaxID=261450 RepID=A0A835H2M8_9MAGN|nr:hypothetical protein IFM89_035726 [Coptis chinensis]